MALTKADMTDKLIKKPDFPKKVALQFVETFFDKIVQELVAGNNVKVSGFGVFRIRKKASRPGRNPKTGEPVEVSSRTVAIFQAGRKLKSVIAAIQENN